MIDQIRYDHNGKKIVLGINSPPDRKYVVHRNFFRARRLRCFYLEWTGEVVDLHYGEQTGNITSGEPSTETDPG